MMFMPVRARSAAVFLGGILIFAWVSVVSAQTNYYSANGTQYAVVPPLLGDQMFPDAAITPTNGVVVWQDNATDTNGLGISAQRLDATLNGTLSPFRVNVNEAGNQENPRVALLKKGGAAFVWQGGPEGFQHIYARFLSVSNIFLSTNDILVSTSTNYYQVNPALAVLTNGNVAVVWSSFYQVNSNSMQDVYCQILSTNGAKVGTNFLVNQFTSYNQRTPTVAGLKNGGMVIGWVSEQERRLVSPSLGSNTTYAAAAAVPTPSVDIYARIYNASGTPSTSEFLVNTNINVCANPAVAAAADGSFMMAWGEFNSLNPSNSWDIYARPFSGAGAGGPVVLVNTHTYGDQYVPRISCIGLDYLVAWTSMGQDGSREGVYAQFIHDNGVPVGGEFLVNTTTIGQQMQPVVASDGVSQFLAVWTSFDGYPLGFDLYAQRYQNVSALLQPMSAPYVWVPFVVSNNVYQPELVVSWAPVLGLSVTNYQVFVDGNGPTGIVTGNSWTMTAANGLATGSSHYFQVEYVTTDGRVSPISPAAGGTTWDGLNWGGIPSEWMIEYYGSNITQWPAPGALLGPNMTLLQVFLSGGDPLEPGTWLEQQFTKTAEGMFLSWNTQPGATYQVQTTTDLIHWNNVGSPRFAAGATDSIDVGSGADSYYRIQLLR